MKTLGQTETKISEIGQGTWQYGGGPEPLRLGVSLGATLIDTAEMYHTEETVGRAIDGIRETVFVATKVWPGHLRHDDVIKAAEASIRRLRVQTIDLYQVHWPNPRVPIAETMRAMEDLVKMGKVRYIGVSNFSVKEMKDAQEALSSSPLVSNQVKYNVLDREIEEDILPYCESEKVSVIAYSPLARGRIAKSSRQDGSILEEIALKYKKTMSQISLNWLTSRGNVVAIPKADSLEHVRENCGASGWHLSPKDVKAIDQAFT